MDLENLKLKAKLKRKENTKFFRRLKTINSKKLDQSIHKLHDKVFSCTDCLIRAEAVFK